MSKKSTMMKHSTLVTELTAEEAASIQGGSLVPDVNVSPTVNVNVSPSIIVGVGGPAINTGRINNSGGGDNILTGGSGVVFQ
jgi:hypothetical protein